VLPSAQPPPLTKDLLQKKWPAIIETVVDEKIHKGELLNQTQVQDVRGNNIIIAVPSSHHRRFLASQEQYLRGIIHKQIHFPVERVIFELHETLSDGQIKKQLPDINPAEYMRRQRKQSPVIKTLIEEFQAEIKW